MGFPTLKKFILQEYSGIQYAEDELMFVVTSAGIISGKPFRYEENVAIPDYANFLKKKASEYRISNNIKKGVSLDGDDGFFVLTDVTLKSSSAPTTKFPYLVIFYDQVIGVSFGSYSD
ncbi:hypothetical protein [Clostridium sp. KNHs205]|uniref:hypothetical protein n=1 Tax=Clostridium sp. KNHs205 TaxID=1449050 RepID=UPI00051B5C53|nr:hypothetical protein [Clostridium sp. KNHs205]